LPHNLLIETWLIANWFANWFAGYATPDLSCPCPVISWHSAFLIIPDHRAEQVNGLHGKISMPTTVSILWQLDALKVKISFMAA
jgi:hypothetical protein